MTHFNNLMIPIAWPVFDSIQLLRTDPESDFHLEEIHLLTDVCRDCEGSGITWDGIVLYPQDFDEDPDLHNSVMEGAFDKPCPECRGNKVVRYPDHNVRTRSIELLEQALDDRLQYELERDAERRAGC